MARRVKLYRVRSRMANPRAARGSRHAADKAVDTCAAVEASSGHTAGCEGPCRRITTFFDTLPARQLRPHQVHGAYPRDQLRHAVYTKKFLTLYYYVFLSNDIETSAYRPAVVEIFDRYIASLPEAVRESAERFFYPEDGAINFKSEDFNLFANFAGRRVSAPGRNARSICAARRSTISPC
mgnify:CR=1 FL=1